MTLAIKKATRQGTKALVGFWGNSGGGKTYSALLLARGLVGPSGRIVLIDTENGRGSIFADNVPGGFDVIDLEPPFSPEHYIEALEEAEKAKADCIIIDSMSHSHDGEGGILDMQEDELQRMAKDDWQKREQCKMAAWIKPKMQAKFLVQKILRLKCPLICCLRATEKTIIRKEGGKTVIEKNQFTTPIMDPKFVFELLLNFECFANDKGQGGFVKVRKVPIGVDFLPQEGQQIGIKTGELLAQWCNAPKGPGTAKPAVKSERDILAQKLFKITQPWHHGEKSACRQWLVDEALIDPAIPLEDLTEVELRLAITKIEQRAHTTP